MTLNWTTKEKIVLISNILEFGDQPESWNSITNDLLKTFPTNSIPSQAKRDGRYAIKVGFFTKIIFRNVIKICSFRIVN